MTSRRDFIKLLGLGALIPAVKGGVIEEAVEMSPPYVEHSRAGIQCV